ncbi:unnamed protein product [Sympodiomycopsis kandeliae]
MPRHPKTDPPLDSFGPALDLASIPQDERDNDQPAAWIDHAIAKDVSDIPLSEGCSPLVYGGGAWGSGMYNDDSLIKSSTPLRTLRLAFQYGINCIDTSPYYYPSEFILGKALEELRSEWPRNTYYLCTKAGRYGPNVSEFDYSPQNIRQSVQSSLKRLRTEYLDLVYLHDVEFVAEKVGKGQDDGFAAYQAVGQEDVARSLGLADDQKDIVHGRGDEVLLAAVSTLIELKKEGLIRNIGISAYPLPVLLRLSRLVESRLGQSLDAILSYSNHTLHSDLLPLYKPLFNPSILLFNGSPFSMGLLTERGAPEWHPASNALQKACKQSSEQLQPVSLAQVALTFGIRGSEDSSTRTLLGMSEIQHVHAAIRAHRLLKEGHETEEYRKQLQHEQVVKGNVEKAGALNWSWASPPPDAY